MRPLMLAVFLALAVPFLAGGRQAQRPLTRESLLLAVDRLLEARPYPPDPKAPPGLSPDQALLQAGLGSADPIIRAAAVRSLGRFENPIYVDLLAPYLADKSLDVQREAARAIAQTLNTDEGRGVPQAAATLVANAGNMEARVALTSLHYLGQFPADVLRLPAFLLTRLAAREPTVRLSTGRLLLLREAAEYDPPDRSALELLLRQHDEDIPAMWTATRHSCFETELGAPAGFCGWQTRYVVAAFADPQVSAARDMLALLSHDNVLQVRMAAVRRLASLIPVTNSCLTALDVVGHSTGYPVEQVDAIRLLDVHCIEHDQIGSLLGDLARSLGDSVGQSALEALATFDPPVANSIVTEAAIFHTEWHARASAARAATTLKNEPALLALAEDRDDNVRSEALEGLRAIGSSRTAEIALRALSSTDLRLVAVAAGALTGTKDPEPAALGLLAALSRITGLGMDTSRETRLAIITRLGEMARFKVDGASLLATSAFALRDYLEDYDPMVAGAVADLLAVIGGPRPQPKPTHRPITQPTENDLLALPTQAALRLSTGDRIVFDLLTKEAPITIARFVKLVSQGYYNNTEFHRLAPLVTVQGGSPRANDYSGDSRFLRDELGLERHTRGTLGMMNHGRDTVNMQFFIDLMDQPTFDLQYTVFGRIQQGPRAGQIYMNALDRIVEGTKILQVVIVRR